MTGPGKTADLVVVGSSNTDMVVASERLPRPGETVLGGDFYQAAGGKGANQAVAAARAGARVAFVGCVGKDDFGRQMRENMSREGIDLSRLELREGVLSGVALILVDGKGRNLISVAPGANGRVTPATVDEARDLIEGARVLLMQLEVPLCTVEHAAALATRANGAVVLNPAPAPSAPLPGSLLKKVAVLIANEEEISALCPSRGSRSLREEAAAGLMAQGVGRVVVTLGDRGGVVFEPGGKSWCFDTPQVKAVDTVGAGDCFCGWLAAAMAKGVPFETGVRRAARAAALSVTRRGAQPSFPGRDDDSG